MSNNDIDQTADHKQMTIVDTNALIQLIQDYRGNDCEHCMKVAK
jgi:hypothetical protein